MPSWLTTFLNHQEEIRLKQEETRLKQEETRLKQEESRERHHAEELQILRDLPTSRVNNPNDNRTQETTAKTHHLDHHYWR